MRWDDLSEELQEYYYEIGILEMTDNWIDDVCDVYDELVDVDIELLLFEKNREYNEHIYKLKYWALPNNSSLQEFYFSNEFKEVERNYEYYEKFKTKFKHGKLRSKGEKYLYKILLKKKVKFVFGESDGCRNDKTKRPLIFDFIIYHKGIKIYVEIQGGQHFNYNPFFYENIESFEDRLYKDKIKKEFAEKNGIFVTLDYPCSDLNYLDSEINKKLLPLIK